MTEEKNTTNNEEKEEVSEKKSGIVTLVGRSNVGKSTLLNALVGFKMAPVSPKAQTTRFAVKGILDDERGQVVFVDTPGLFLSVPDRLTRVVNKQVKENIKGIDLLLYVVDPTREIGQEEKRLLSMVRNIENKILVINKIDIPNPKYLYDYENLKDDFLEMVKISARDGKHLKTLLDIVFKHLPYGDPIYSKEERLANEKTLKDWMAEIIREKVFLYVHQEIPYSVHAFVESVENKGDMLVVKAKIVTDEDRYKPMLIGKGAQKLKQIGTAARKELELILQKKIFLDLEVEVDKNWIDRVELQLSDEL